VLPNRLKRTANLGLLELLKVDPGRLHQTIQQKGRLQKYNYRLSPIPLASVRLLLRLRSIALGLKNRPLCDSPSTKHYLLHRTRSSATFIPSQLQTFNRFTL